MSTLTIAPVATGLTTVERDLVRLEDGFLTYWHADARLRRAIVADARRTYRAFRADFGYSDSDSALFTSPERQPKIGKSKVWTLALTIVPARSVLGNACPMASKGCGGDSQTEGGCLNTAGKGGMDAVQYARLVRYAVLLTFPREAVLMMGAEITSAMRKRGSVAVRLNCVSDIRWERVAPAMLQALHGSGVAVYDYTSWAPRFRADRPDFYHITFSAKETHSVAWIRELVAQGHNVAVPVFWRKGEDFPSTWQGMPAIDGDKSDYRPDDASGVVVLLRAKGEARHDTSGFVRVMVA